MQTTPTSAKLTIKRLRSQTSTGPKRRLIFLAATAAVAGIVGVVLGSTVRFHVATVGEAPPLFKPQQEFPPLAEWPPQVPSPPSDSDEQLGPPIDGPAGTDSGWHTPMLETSGLAPSESTPNSDTIQDPADAMVTNLASGYEAFSNDAEL